MPWPLFVTLPGKASVSIAHAGLAKPLTRDAKRRAQFTVASRPKTVVEFSPFCVCQEAVDGDAKVIISRLRQAVVSFETYTVEIGGFPLPIAKSSAEEGKHACSPSVFAVR